MSSVDPARCVRERAALRAAIGIHLTATLGCVLFAWNMSERILFPGFLRELLFVSAFPLGISCLACPIISLAIIFDLRCSSILARLTALVITTAMSAVQLLACLPHVQ